MRQSRVFRYYGRAAVTPKGKEKATVSVPGHAVMVRDWLRACRDRRDAMVFVCGRGDMAAYRIRGAPLDHAWIGKSVRAETL